MLWLYITYEGLKLFSAMIYATADAKTLYITYEGLKLVVCFGCMASCIFCCTLPMRD